MSTPADASLLDHALSNLELAASEVERLEKLSKSLSDALLTIRPLGGSELFIKSGGQYYADPAYCKAAIEELRNRCHEACKAEVRERRRALAAESRLQAVRASTLEEAAQAIEGNLPFPWSPNVKAALRACAATCRTLATKEGQK